MVHATMNTDIVKQLDEQQKKAFLHAFIKMACVDGYFDEREKNFIYNVALNLGLDYKATEELMNCQDTKQILKEVALIKNRAVALELIKELCLLSHIDGQLSDEETLFIGDVAQATNIELEKVEQISNWVINYLILHEQSKIVFEQI